MRIAFYSYTFSPAWGGMERFGEDLVAWLTEKGHEVTVVTSTPGARDSDRKRPYPVVRGSSRSAAVHAFRRADLAHISGLSLRGVGLARLTGRPTVVTHHGYQAVCPAGLMMPRTGTCRATGLAPGPCHGCPARGARGHVSVRAHRFGAAAVAANVGVSRFLTNRIGVPRAHAIHNGMTPSALGEVAEGPGQDGLIAFAGRLVEEKGLDLLLRALPSLPRSRLEVAGDGPILGDLQQQVIELGLDSRVRFLGRLSPEGVRRLYSRAAVVCVPSRWHEAFGYAASEAMAVGRAVVATPFGALTELLEGRRGVLAKDASPEAVADALGTVLADPAARSAMGAAARRFAVEHLSIEAVGRQYERVYREVLP
ncbi:MAG: glycosyltransferase family 4 protein [Myxococcota bacterium]